MNLKCKFKKFCKNYLIYYKQILLKFLFLKFFLKKVNSFVKRIKYVSALKYSSIFKTLFLESAKNVIQEKALSA